MADKDSIQPTLLFTVLCDDVRREDNGKFMLLGIFETIGVRRFPAIHPTLFIMNCWASGTGTFRQRSRIVKRDGTVLAQDKETEFTLKELKSKHRVIARFNNLRFDGPDEYAVEILLDGNLKVRYPLVVKAVPIPPQQKPFGGQNGQS